MSKPSADDKISQLRDNVLAYHPAWIVDLPGVGACSLNVTDNTQGRLLNDVSAASVCTTSELSYTPVDLSISNKILIIVTPPIGSRR